MTGNNFLHKIDQLKNEIENAKGQIKNISDLETFRVKYAGRKGAISSLFKEIGELSAEERGKAGQNINKLKAHVNQFIESHRFSESSKTEEKAFFDATLPGDPVRIGSIHPINIVLRNIKDIFQKMGFSVVQGPEVESEYYNFEALNIPEGHPARDMQDTLFVDDSSVLRTHTSPVQIRTMEKQQPPVRIISPGKCYRRDKQFCKKLNTPMGISSYLLMNSTHLLVQEHQKDQWMPPIC